MSEFNSQAELPEGATLIASSQTAGRGQRGNRWESEPGKNLTFSVLLKPRFLEAKDQFQLNMAVSLAVANALQPGLPKSIRLKWPNDILVEGRKIGGILMENQLSGPFLASTIIGIGINVNQVDFSFPSASSLAIITGHAWDLNDTFQRLLEAIEQEYLELRSHKGHEIKEQYLALLYQLSEPFQYKSGDEYFTGTISGVGADGRLCVWVDGKERRFSFKEIEFLV